MGGLAFLIRQVNKEGDETGLVKVAVGATSARRFIRSCGGSGDLGAVGSMKEGDFEPVVYGDHVYEVECFREDQAGQAEVDARDVIGRHAYDVYEVTDGVLKPVYAFGEEDLVKEMEEAGMSREDAGRMVPERPGMSVERTLTDPVDRKVVVRSLTDEEIDEKSANQEFKADLVAAYNMNEAKGAPGEGHADMEEEYGGFRLKARSLDYGRNECSVSLPDGRLVEVRHGYGDASRALRDAKAMIDSPSEEFRSQLKLMGLDGRDLGFLREASEDGGGRTFIRNSPYGGLTVTAVGFHDGRAAYYIDLDGAVVEMWTGTGTVEDALKYARASIDSHGDDLRSKVAGTGKVDEASCKDLDYCQKHVHVTVRDGKVFTTIGPCVCGGKMDEAAGAAVRTFGPFRSGEAAVEAAKFCIDSGICESAGKVMAVEFSASVAARARDAIEDSPFLKHNTRWISSDVLEFVDDEDGSVTSDVLEQMNEFGIDEEDVDIHEVEDFDEGDKEKTMEFSLSVAGKAQQAVDDMGLDRARWIAGNVLAFMDDEDGSVETAIRERLGQAGIPDGEYD